MAPRGLESNYGGQMLGKLFASLLVTRTDPVAGGNPEETLSCAASFVAQGDIFQACQQLDKLEGYPKHAVQDWHKDAVHYLVHKQYVDFMSSKLVSF